MQAPPTGIGETLRRAREARRLTLADAERLTKIRGTHLAALEEERFQALPPPPYAKGFVRAYARLLGLDADQLAAEFEARVPPSPRPGLSRPVEIPLEPGVPVSRWRRILTYVLWGLLLVAVYLGYVGYAQVRQFVRSGPEGPTPAPVKTATPPRATPPAAVVAPVAPAPTPAVSPAPFGAVAVVLTTSGTSWVRVIADGQRVFQGILETDESRAWSAQRDMIIRIGNAAAVELVVNGRRLGPLGRPGEVVELSFPEKPEEP